MNPKPRIDILPLNGDQYVYKHWPFERLTSTRPAPFEPNRGQWVQSLHPILGDKNDKPGEPVKWSDIRHLGA